MAVTVYEKLDPEMLLEDPKDSDLKPETPRTGEDALAVKEREERDRMARDKVQMENEQRRKRGSRLAIMSNNTKYRKN